MPFLQFFNMYIMYKSCTCLSHTKLVNNIKTYFVSYIFSANEISMDNMISICKDGSPSMIGRKKGLVSRLIGDRNACASHCALHR